MVAQTSLPNSDPQSFVAAIFALYQQRGELFYEEDVTQIDHALQTAHLAIGAGVGDALVVAALLHDVGHLFEEYDEGEEGALAEDHRHEALGAQALAVFLPTAVTEPIRMHVVAKRYLCALEPGYHADLSAASVRSLALQGGVLSDAACDRFAKHRYFESAVLLRKFDEGAKQLEAQASGLEQFRGMILGLCRPPVA
jgi:predicted HD phosphohydrolase